VIITSKNPKYLNLGRDLEKATLRMAQIRKFIDMAQKCFGSGLVVLESFKEIDSKGKLIQPKDDKLEHIVQTKMILSNLQECLAIADDEFDKYATEFTKLDKTLTRLQNAPKPIVKKPRTDSIKAASEVPPPTEVVLPPDLSKIYPDAVPFKPDTPESKGN
jgi:hypothetical protein